MATQAMKVLHQLTPFALALLVACTAIDNEPIAPDALTLMPETQFQVFNTAAGTLRCAPGLCKTDTGADKEFDGPEWSYHFVRLSAKGKELALRATEGSSGDPAYTLAQLEIAGEDAYLPGDGCVYVHQSANAYFSLTKRYCLSSSGSIARVRQETYPLQHSLRLPESVAVFKYRNYKTQIYTTTANELLTATAALVNEDEDFYGSAMWFKVRTRTGLTGWIQVPEGVPIPQCDVRGSNDIAICYNGD